MNAAKPRAIFRVPFLLGAAALAAVSSPAGLAYAGEGCVEQATLPAGCVSQGGSGGCSTGRVLNGAYDTAISPDGNSAYVASAFGTDGNAIAVFDRSLVTGLLTQKAGTAGCVSDTGNAGSCVDGVALGGAQSLAISSDGDHLYVAAGSAGAVAVFDRAGSGALTQKAGTAGCISDNGSGGACVDGKALTGANRVILSPDGKNVYVSSPNRGAIAVFSVNAADGTLTQLAGLAGCVSDDGTGGLCADGVAMASLNGLAISPDGNNVYATGASSHSVLVFDRNPTTGALTQKAGLAGCISEDGSGGACADGNALLGPEVITVSPDGKTVYSGQGLAGGSDSIAIFDRDLITGALTQKAGTDGCVSASGTGGTCATGRSLLSVFGLAVSGDNVNLYAGINDSHGLAIFDRDPGTGVITQRPGMQGCVNSAGSSGCASGSALTDANRVVMGPDDETIYLTASTSDSVVLFRRKDALSCPTTTTTTITDTTTSTTTTTVAPTTTTTLAAGECPSVPYEGCRADPGKARLRIKTASAPGAGIEFLWKRGQATDIEEFGDPVTGTTELELCIYSAGIGLDALTVPAGGTCDGRPCWYAAGARRFVYRDGSGSNDGVRDVILKEGPDGESRLYVRARGAGVPVPALPLDLPLLVQVVSRDASGERCWEAGFTTAAVNRDTKLEAVAR